MCMNYVFGIRTQCVLHTHTQNMCVCSINGKSTSTKVSNIYSRLAGQSVPNKMIIRDKSQSETIHLVPGYVQLNRDVCDWCADHRMHKAQHITNVHIAATGEHMNAM